MTFDQFHNGLRVLINIDRPDFVANGGTDADWPRFQNNPWDWFIRAPTVKASKLWAYMQTRMSH